MRHFRLFIGMLVTAGLVAILAVSPAYAPPPYEVAGLYHASAVVQRHTDDLLRTRGVVGTAVTVTDGAPAIMILTEPGVTGLPATLEGVPTVVRVTGKLYALHHADWHQGGPGGGGGGGGNGEEETSDCSTTTVCPVPVHIGVSTGNEYECSAGTIGARVTDGNNVYALSNNHVYALENDAPEDSNVLQPGRYDTNCDGTSNNAIGILFDFEPIVFSTSASNEIDAAIAVSSIDMLGNATPSNGYGTPKSALVAAAVGLNVQKYGRTTELTKGVITGVNATVNVGYSSGTARFVGQIIVESNKPFIKAGDSGSLLVTDPGLNPVGLLFAGNRSGKLAVANRIDLVRDRFNVAIDGE